MSFVTWQYALLLGGVFATFWCLPARGRLPVLFAASYWFYGSWDARFLALLLTSTVCDYFCALAIDGIRRPARLVVLANSLPLAWLGICTLTHAGRAAPGPGAYVAATIFSLSFSTLYQIFWKLDVARRRRAFLTLSVGVGIGALGFFKYFEFFIDSIVAVLVAMGWRPEWRLFEIVLPVGISFYTFQSLSYTVDVFRGTTKPTRSLVTFATYLAFFPQLVAGPIERSGHLLPQLTSWPSWKSENLTLGIRWILIGCFKKVFVGDNCAMLANYAFDPETALDAPWALLGVLAFAFQIYGDFSGYSDIARGSARLLGIDLSPNFRLPYLARGPSEFWQRWHITLSTWFRDYVYVPLGGNRRGVGLTLRNLWITMLLAGLWHGANWTFVLWGAYHAALLSLYRFVPLLYGMSETSGPRSIPSISWMFCLTLIGWAIFRCEDMAQLGRWFAAFGTWDSASTPDWLGPLGWWLLHVVPLLLVQFGTWRSGDEAATDRWPWPVRGVVYALMFLLIVSSTSGDQEFIYFQF
jgi:alginate O-acetyltransferase complex protein AlgI